MRALIDRLGEEETRPFLRADGEAHGESDDGDGYQQPLGGSLSPMDGKLGLRATARLSLQFCLLWVRKLSLYCLRSWDGLLTFITSSL